MSTKNIEVHRHGILLLFSTIGVTGISFVSTIFFARTVGAEILGIYFLFLSYFGLITLFNEIGINYAGTVRISEGKEIEEYYTASFFLRIILTTIIVILLLIFHNLLGNLNEMGIVWFLIIVLFVSLVNAHIETGIAGGNRLGLMAFGRLLSTIARSCVQVIAIILGYSIFGLLGGYISGFLVQILIEYRYLDFHLKRFSLIHIKSIFSYSIGASTTSFGNIIFESIGIIVIGYYMTITDVGIYGVCWGFSAFAIIVSSALINTLFNKISYWKSQGDIDSIAKSFSRAYIYSLTVSIPIFFGGVILGKNLLQYIYSQEFIVGIVPLIILIAMRIFQSIQQIICNILMAMDYVRMAFYVTFVMAIVNIILAFLFIPYFGLIGAALASLFAVAISVIIAYYPISRIIPVTIERKQIFFIMVSVILMSSILLISIHFITLTGAVPTITLIIIGAVIYFITLFSLDNQFQRDVKNTLKIKWI